MSDSFFGGFGPPIPGGSGFNPYDVSPNAQSQSNQHYPQQMYNPFTTASNFYTQAAYPQAMSYQSTQFSSPSAPPSNDLNLPGGISIQRSTQKANPISSMPGVPRGIQIECTSGAKPLTPAKNSSSYVKEQSGRSVPKLPSGISIVQSSSQSSSQFTSKNVPTSAEGYTAPPPQTKSRNVDQSSFGLDKLNRLAGISIAKPGAATTSPAKAASKPSINSPLAQLTKLAAPESHTSRTLPSSIQATTIKTSTTTSTSVPIPSSVTKSDAPVPRTYRPLVKHFTSVDGDCGFDLSRVKMEPGLRESELLYPTVPPPCFTSRRITSSEKIDASVNDEKDSSKCENNDKRSISTISILPSNEKLSDSEPEDSDAEKENENQKLQLETATQNSNVQADDGSPKDVDDLKEERLSKTTKLGEEKKTAKLNEKDALDDTTSEFEIKSEFGENFDEVFEPREDDSSSNFDDKKDASEMSSGSFKKPVVGEASEVDTPTKRPRLMSFDAESSNLSDMMSDSESVTTEDRKKASSTTRECKHEGLADGELAQQQQYYLQQLNFYRTPTTGSATVCIFCLTNCYSKQKKPQLLNCLHSACFECFQERKEAARSDSKSLAVVTSIDDECKPEADSEVVVACPICKTTTSSTDIVDNFFLHAETTEVVDNIEPKICQSCDDQAIAKQLCEDCDEYLCDDCVKAHKRVKMTKDHSIKEVHFGSVNNETSAASGQKKDAPCPLHKTERLLFFCEPCDEMTCRECQLSEVHRGHNFRPTHEVIEDIKVGLQEGISDVRLKKNVLEENIALLGTKLSEITIKEKSMLTQLKDLKDYLIAKIESRFLELQKDVQKNVHSKKRAVESRRKFLDRNFVQADYAQAFIEYAVAHSSQEKAFFASKKHMDKQIRRIKKVDPSTGLTDHNRELKLDLYFQQFSGQHLHAAMESMLSQTLGDLKVLSGPPPAPQTPTVHTTSQFNEVVSSGSPSRAGIPTTPRKEPPSRFPISSSSPLRTPTSTPVKRPMATTPKSSPARPVKSLSAAATRGLLIRGRAGSTPLRGGSARGSLRAVPSKPPSTRGSRGSTRGRITASTLLSIGRGGRGASARGVNVRGSPARGGSTRGQSARGGVSGKSGVTGSGVARSAGTQSGLPVNLPSGLSIVSSNARPAPVGSRGPSSVNAREGYPVQQMYPQSSLPGHKAQQAQRSQSHQLAMHHSSQQNQPSQNVSPYFMAAYGQAQAAPSVMSPPPPPLQKMPNTSLPYSPTMQQTIPPPIGSPGSSWHIPQDNTSGSQLVVQPGNVRIPDNSFKITIPSPKRSSNKSSNPEVIDLDDDDEGLGENPASHGVGSQSQITNTISQPLQRENVKLMDKTGEQKEDMVNTDLMPDLSSILDDDVSGSDWLRENIFKDSLTIEENSLKEEQTEQTNSSHETSKAKDQTSSGHETSKAKDQTNSGHETSKAKVLGANVVKITLKSTKKENQKPMVTIGEVDLGSMIDPHNVKLELGNLNSNTPVIDGHSENSKSSKTPLTKRCPPKSTEEKTSNEEHEGAEEWCALCHDGGDLLYCCDRCPKVYHLACYIPPLLKEPEDTWTCMMCKEYGEIMFLPNEPEGKSKMGQRDLAICRRILFEMYNRYPESFTFRDCSELLDFKEYMQVIKEPVALDLIKERLHPDSDDQYVRIQEFLSDLRKMFKNCYTFHGKGSDYFAQAKTLEERLDKVLEFWIPEFAYDDTISSSSRKKGKRPASPQPGPSGIRHSRKRKSSVVDDDAKKSRKKKKKKKMRDEDSDLSDFITEHSDSDLDDIPSSPGEHLDMLDAFERRLAKKHKGKK